MHKIAQCCLLLILSLGAQSDAAETINLGGKEVPAEKFHVFVVYGDSNTFGSGNPTSEWKSPRAWRMNAKGEWEQAESEFPMYPGSKYANTSKCGVGWWVLRYLTEHYPDHYFGLLQYCDTSSGEGTSAHEVVGEFYDPTMAYLEPYVGKFHFICIVMEAGMTGSQHLENFDKIRELLREDLGIEKVPVVFSGWRLNNYGCNPNRTTDPRVTQKVFPDYTRLSERGGHTWGWHAIVNGCRLAQQRENVALIFGFNAGMKDNRHMLGLTENGQWGHDEFNKRFFYSIVANGWAVPDSEADMEAPTAPSNLHTENLWHEGVTLSWDAGTDNLAVKGYEVFANGGKVPWWPTLPNDLCMVTSATTRFPVSGLEPGTDYELKVRTVDYAENRSAFSEAVHVRMRAQRETVETPFRVNVGGPAEGGWVADKPYRDGGSYGYVLSPGYFGEEKNKPYINRTGPISEAFPEDAPERTMLGWFRRAPNVYRFDVPNGEYRVTWFVRVAHYKLKLRADHLLTTPENNFNVREVPDNYTMRDWLPESPYGKLFNQGEPYGDIGRTPARTYTVTDGKIIANPMDQKAVGHTGFSIYGVMLERLDREGERPTRMRNEEPQ